MGVKCEAQNLRGNFYESLVILLNVLSTVVWFLNSRERLNWVQLESSVEEHVLILQSFPKNRRA
jgi:hypothetical protein